MTDGPFEFNGQIVDRHLGGYTPGGDPCSHYPALWEWLTAEYDIRSVIDVGCGDGSEMAYFRTLGVEAVIGVDGIPQAEETIFEHDYSTGPWPTDGSWFLDPMHPGWDVVWACEFVEHVEEEHVGNFLATFALGSLVLMTHALPGQTSGHHHVNLRDDHYWIGRMSSIGYGCDVALTQKLRALARQEDIPAAENYFFRSGLAFVPGSTAGPGFLAV